VYSFALPGREISPVPEATKFATQILTFQTSRVIMGTPLQSMFDIALGSNGKQFWEKTEHLQSY